MVNNEILDFCEHLDHATDRTGVVECLRNGVGALGVDFFCLNLFPQPHQNFEEVMLASRVPLEWLALYIEEGFCHADPAIRQCKYVVNPFYYVDAQYDAQTEPRAAEVVRRASDFGLGDGILVPIPSATGCIGDVWMGGHDRPPRKHLPMLHLMALYAFYRAQAVCDLDQVTTPNLSPREKEVLKWIACGKTAWEVGQILKISRRTVEWHLGQACKELGASNRAQAVAIAIQRRLLSF